MKHPINRMTEEEMLRAFRVMVNSALRAVFLGGAGVSTESGIPDFRSRDGLYHKTEKRFARYQPEYLLSYECLRNEPDVFFDYYRSHLDARAVEPNAAHRVLAQWEKDGRLAGVITQNIDGLHQKAGSVNVQEIHGTTWKNHCVQCGAAYGVAALRLVAVPLVVIAALVGVRACVPALNPVMAVAISTAAAAPTAALTTVIAARYDKDVSTATSLVSGTTLLSILTMPPIVGFALWLFVH